MTVDVRVDVVPPSPFRLGGASKDGLLRRRGPGLQRLLHRDGRPVHVGAAQVSERCVRIGARASDRELAEWGVARMRFALGVDDDLREFVERFKGDPLIGRAIRAAPWLRVRRRPTPWEALAWAICEQLIEYDRAAAIERRLIARYGLRCAATGLRDAPAPATVAGLAPAELAACDLAPKRALTLRTAAGYVARGRIDLWAPDHEHAWRQLRSISGIGAWTVEYLALLGQGRHDQLPAADLGYLRMVGRLTTGNPRARADEAEVRGLFARYGEWKGLAGEYALLAVGRGLVGPAAARLAAA